MKLFTVAGRENINYDGGPGASSTKVWKIKPMGAYGTGPFPPVFTDRKYAEMYRETLEWPRFYKVVELNLER